MQHSAVGFSILCGTASSDIQDSPTVNLINYICLFFCSERYEALIDKEIGCGDISVTGHHQSRDSAIDTEVQECEMEICEIDLVNNL